MVERVIGDIYSLISTRSLQKFCRNKTHRSILVSDENKATTEQLNTKNAELSVRKVGVQSQEMSVWAEKAKDGLLEAVFSGTEKSRMLESGGVSVL